MAAKEYEPGYARVRYQALDALVKEYRAIVKALTVQRDKYKPAGADAPAGSD